MSESISGQSEDNPVPENLRPVLEFLEASIAEAAELPNASDRDLIAVCQVERQAEGFSYLTGSQIIGDILGVDTSFPLQPCVVLGNVVHYTESDESVRIVLSTCDIEQVPLTSVTDPFLTNHLRHGSCAGDSWHKDYFPSTD